MLAASQGRNNAGISTFAINFGIIELTENQAAIAGDGD